MISTEKCGHPIRSYGGNAGRSCSRTAGHAGHHRSTESRAQQTRATVTRNRRLAKELRAQVITKLGGHCVFCFGTTDLQLDHGNRDGKQHREQARNGSVKYYREMLANKYAIQIVCSKCHRAKSALEQRGTLGTANIADVVAKRKD